MCRVERGQLLRPTDAARLGVAIVDSVIHMSLCNKTQAKSFQLDITPTIQRNVPQLHIRQNLKVENGKKHSGKKAVGKLWEGEEAEGLKGGPWGLGRDLKEIYFGDSPWNPYHPRRPDGDRALVVTCRLGNLRCQPQARASRGRSLPELLLRLRPVVISCRK